jgi:glycosyltransferase involved in cell wall biosynthesis
MKISIVIPVYNEAQNLDACLRAIARQTTAPYEVIVVDNNCTDGSLAVAQTFPFVTVITERRQGIVHARDRGYNAARGDVIARIDADSLLPKDWLEHIARFYADPEHQNQAFSGGAVFYNVRLPGAVAWLYNFLAFDLNRWLIGHPTLWGSNMALTRRQWQAVKTTVCRQNGLHEDLDLAIHLNEHGFGIFYDRRLRVAANLKRVRSRRRELWDYLQWWPRTLRRHGRRGWWLAWLFGALLLYMLTPLLNLAEYLARWFGLLPLKDSLGTDRV